MCLLYNPLIDMTIEIIFFLLDWKNYVDRSILVISMTVLPGAQHFLMSKI